MTGLPQRWVVLDTESTDNPHAERLLARVLTLQLGVLRIHDRDARGHPTLACHRFHTASEFHAVIDAIPLNRQPIVIFAHNMGHDARQIEWLRWMGLGRYTATPSSDQPNAKRLGKPLFVIDDPVFIIRCFRPDGQAILVTDSVMWLEKSIKVLGDKIGLPKLDDPGQDASEEQRFAYCERDAEILDRCLDRLFRWMDRHGMPNFPETPSKLSIVTYRARYGKQRITPPEEPDDLRLDRHAYYGGIVEAFRTGRFEGPVHKLDVSSLYPYVMSQNLFPCKFSERGDFSAYSPVPDQFDPACCTAEVYLDSPWLAWPVKGQGSTLLCTGRVRTILCGPELVRAFAANVVVKIGRWVRWETDDLFSRFVADFWRDRLRCRRDKDPIGEQMCKSIMVRLHGKFGQKTRPWIPAGKNHDRNLFAMGLYGGERPEDDRMMRVIGGIEEIQGEECEDANGFVPIAAWTTSYARVYMWELIHTAGLDNVYHVATDAILCNGIGLGNLQLAGMVQEDTLGKLKYEGSEEWVEVYGQNTLDFPGWKMRPGVKIGAEEIAPDHWCVDSWESFSAAFYTSNWCSTVIQKQLKITSRHCSRMRSLADGSMIPWSVNNWDVSPLEQLRTPIRPRESRENP